MIWTKTDGDPTWRFTEDQPDSLYEPDSGYVEGRPPVIFMTGGGTLANSNPATIGADGFLEALTDGHGYVVGQCNVPWLLGNDLAMERMEDCAAWLRTNRGASADPPVWVGISNGGVCGLIYSRQFPITGGVDILPVTAGIDAYNEDPYGVRAHIEEAWDVTWPELPPPRFSPYDDVTNYPDLRHKLQAWYAGGDPLIVSKQMSFLAHPNIEAEMHNVGAYGHLGTLEDFTAPVAHIDFERLADFVDECVAAV